MSDRTAVGWMAGIATALTASVMTAVRSAVTVAILGAVLSLPQAPTIGSPVRCFLHLFAAALLPAPALAQSSADAQQPSWGRRNVDSVRPGSSREGVLSPLTRLAHPRLEECSGIVFHQGAWFAHNDSGDDPVIYRSESLDFSQAQVLALPGARAVDWEDMTVYQGDLLIGDIGDNLRRRDDISLYRARYLPPSGSRQEPSDGSWNRPEPGVRAENPLVPGVRAENPPAGVRAEKPLVPGAGAESTLTPRERAGRLALIGTYPVRYPDGPHDAEGLAADGDRVLLISKARGERETWVYAFDSLIDSSRLAPGEANVPRKLARLEIGEGEQVTAAEVHAPSRTLVLLTYTRILTYPLDNLGGPPATETLIAARQCESLCFVGADLILTNEQRDVYRIERFLQRGYRSLMPELGEAVLPGRRPTVESANHRRARDEAPRLPVRLPHRRPAAGPWSEIPLEHATEGEELRWTLSGNRLLMRGALEFDPDPQPTQSPSGEDPGQLGSALLLGFGLDRSLMLEGGERILALGLDEAGEPGLWSLDLRPQNLGIHAVPWAVIQGNLLARPEGDNGILRFVLDMDVDSLFPDGIPERFLLEIQANDVREEPQVRFSGPDLYAIYRPYTWGEVKVTAGN